MQSISSFIVLFTLHQFCLCSITALNSKFNFGCPGFEKIPKIGNPVPKLQLSKYPTGKVHQNERDIILQETIGIGVSFSLDCWASYPIDLTFSGHLVIKNEKIERYHFC